MNFRVIAIPAEIASQARTTMKSPQYGHPADTDLATGYGPCRSCLRTFERKKETRILFTHNAFAELSNLPLPSPIFIHQNQCERYETNEFPAGLRALPIVLEGYGSESWLVAREKVANADFENVINRLLLLTPLIIFMLETPKPDVLLPELSVLKKIRSSKVGNI